jgi:hypothetical protein
MTTTPCHPERRAQRDVEGSAPPRRVIAPMARNPLGRVARDARGAEVARHDEEVPVFQLRVLLEEVGQTVHVM